MVIMVLHFLSNIDCKKSKFRVNIINYSSLMRAICDVDFVV